MSLAVKICGLGDEESLKASVDAGAALIGLMFYPPSPRFLEPARAARLAARTPSSLRRVGVFVDPDDDTLAAILDRVPLDMIQLHGHETPSRVAALRARFALPVIKAIRVASAEDLDQARDFEGNADMLLFDAKPPSDMKDALPGGNALRFDWSLLKGRRWTRPWMLSGGLSVANLEQAVHETGARMVDVSSGVERRPGKKDPARIRAFLDLAARL